MFEWNSQLDTGIESIDLQHRQLVALLDKLSEAMEAGTGTDLLSEILESLEDYTAVHFSEEEGYMLDSGYTETSGHRTAHKIFQNKIQELKQDFQKDRHGALSIRLVLFLRNWLTDHIGSIDQQLSKHLRQSGANLNRCG